MVPLLGLFINDNTVTDPRATTEACQAQVQDALLVFARLQQASPTARKTLDAVSRIFEASKRGPGIAVETNSINSANLSPTSREAGVLNTPGILPSHSDGRGFAVTHDSSFTDPFAPSTMDDPNGQYLWDFLSWSDTNIVPMADVENINDGGLLGSDDKHFKYTNTSFFGNQLTEPPFFTNSSIPYYS
jgi:hypothetical protein